MQITWSIGLYTSLLVAAYFATMTLKVVIRLLLLKIKHGDEIDIYYFPILGRFKAMLNDL
jgi:hypothetical protein